MSKKYKLDDSTAADCLKLIEMALTEDTGSASLETAVDCTTQSVIPTAATASAAFVSRQQGIVCGVEIAKLAISTFAPDLTLEVVTDDGQGIAPGQRIAIIHGSAHQILMMERTCLNFMCRLSGISTLSQAFAKKVEGTKAQILDTRKTTPGYRRLEKYAVQCGGGTNHRMGLYDAVMIKDNHLAFYKAWNEDSKDAVAEGIELARNWIKDNQARLPNGPQTVLQLEVDTLEQFERALEHRPDIVLLDNMSNEQLKKAVDRRDEAAPKILLEASGGVNLETIAAIAQTGVDRISIGALTHSATNFDIGLDWTIGS
jgi:nicotinate-nucleotide pyrophosphorylase (carboxylating)